MDINHCMNKNVFDMASIRFKNWYCSELQVTVIEINTFMTFLL
jgi:hypothetical protein